ncbi:MAG: DUF502 domain-containing protein, partial [Nitrospirota bacterium]
AFVTGVMQGQVQAIASEPLVNVYVPTSPNPTSGYFLLVPEREIIPLDMSVEEAMKLIVSGGLYQPAQAAVVGRPVAAGARVEVPISS